MKKTIITFGLISGVISSVLMVCTIPFAHRIGFDKALILGYTSIVLSFPTGIFRHPVVSR